MSILQENMKLLKFLGFWIDKNDRKGASFFLRQVLVHNIGGFAVYGILCGMPLYIYQNADNFSEVSECIGNMAALFMSATLYLTFVLQNDGLTEIVRLLRNIDENHGPNDEGTKKIDENTKKMCYFGSVTIPRVILLPLAIIAFVTVNELFNDTEIEQRLKFVFPIDLKKPVGFQVFCVAYAINFCEVVFMVSAFDILVVCIFINTIGQLKMLNYKLSNLRLAADETLRQQSETKAEIASLMLSQRKPEEEYKVGLNYFGSQQDCTIINECVTFAPVNNTKELVLDSHEKSVERKMISRLHECIVHHNSILDLISKFEAYFNASFSAAIIVGFVQSASILTSPAMNSGSMFLISQFAMIMGYYSIVGITCYLSEKVTTETKLIQESIYGCGWEDCSESFKKSIRLMMSMTSQPVVIKAAGFIPLSMETYNNVLNSAYSYYMVLCDFK